MCIRDRLTTLVMLLYVRFGNLALELSKLGCRQFAVSVVVEAFDEVQCSILRVIQLLA